MKKYSFIYIYNNIKILLFDLVSSDPIASIGMQIVCIFRVVKCVLLAPY